MRESIQSELPDPGLSPLAIWPGTCFYTLRDELTYYLAATPVDELDRAEIRRVPGL